MSKGCQLTNSMGKILYLILNVAWKSRKKHEKYPKLSSIPRYSKCFCHLHQPQIGKRSQLLRPRPPPRRTASAALVHGWFLIRLSVMWLVETMLKLWNWCKNVRCSLSLSMFARSEHVFKPKYPDGSIRVSEATIFWSPSLHRFMNGKRDSVFIGDILSKKDPS